MSQHPPDPPPPRGRDDLWSQIPDLPDRSVPLGDGPADGPDRDGPPPFLPATASVPRIPLELRDTSGLDDVFVRRSRPRDRYWVHAGLFLLTLITTTAVGAGHWLAYQADYRNVPFVVDWGVLVSGFWYSLTILAILGAHEFGHYLACVHYGINASLPYFIPVPPPFLTGTLGAFIRIRQPIGSKRQLFDIGIAGPLAGFAITIPALVLGLAWSHVARLPESSTNMLSLGEPLLFKTVASLIWGPIPDGYSINLHPMAFAAWFGMLATSLNLFPIGQLDGGHICYAVLGKRSTFVTLGAVATAVVLTFFSLSWLVWTVMMVAMLYLFGIRHPRTIDEDIPLDRSRLVLAVVALIVFVACFTPAPIEPFDLLHQ